MSQMLERLVTGENDVERIYQNAGRKGVDVIKLLWGKRGASITSMVGFFVPVLARQEKQQRNFDRVTSVSQSVDMEFGEVRFYPDGDDYRYGYILDTPENRKKLMSSLTKGWFTIQNERVRNEIMDMAEAKGFGTSFKKNTHEYVKKTQEVTDLEATNEKIQKELAASRKKNALLEKKQKKNDEELALAKLDARENSKSVVTDKDVVDDNDTVQDVIKLAKENTKK